MLDIGMEFSNYRVVEHIGRGGMADVWSARDQRLSRTVAIKTIARDLSMDNMNPVKLFEREARTIAALEHPHILPIYEFGEIEGQLFIVMRYVSGGSLEDMLEEGPLPPDQFMKMARSVGQALTHAHTNQVIHLDLKPSNVLLDSYQSPYLADFGLATALDTTGRAKNPGSGTLLYMAPEQLTSDQLDHRADIYSFCIMLYHMMTGQLPFDAAVPMAVRQIQAREDLPDPRYLVPSIPREVAAVLRRGTTLDLNKRVAQVSEIVSALEDIFTPGRLSTRAAQLDALAGGLRVPTPTQVENANTLTDLQMEGLVTRSTPGAPKGVTALDVDLSDMASIPGLSPEDMQRREAEDLFNRARRAWAHGQGRFLLGVTHFMLISDYYRNAAQHKLELDEAGRQVLLRGALEYGHELDYWWSQMDESNQRWVCLHALRSANAPARVRALHALRDLPDDEATQIPRLVAQSLQVEQNKEAKLAAIRLLEARARFMQPTMSLRWL